MTKKQFFNKESWKAMENAITISSLHYTICIFFKQKQGIFLDLDYELKPSIGIIVYKNPMKVNLILLIKRNYHSSFP